MARGWFYDGETAIRHPVELQAEAGRLRLVREDGSTELLTAGQLAHVARRLEHDIYSRDPDSGWRLAVPVAAAELETVLPKRLVYGRWVDRLGLPAAVAASLVASAALLTFGYYLPSLLAPAVPMSWERSYGDLLLGDFAGQGCTGEGGQEALDRLAATLAPDARGIELRVVDWDMVNAAALPGRRIVIFRGLLNQAEGPDELAGILAHEIAHVERRHVTEAMVRQFTFGLFVSVLGGNTGSNVEMFLNASYSRGAESEADGDAIGSLSRANISPLATAAFFNRLGEGEGRFGAVGRGLSYLSTHPVSAERERLFRESARGRAAFKPPLDEDEWQALRDICYGGPAAQGAKSGDFD
jgi:Zn-dependent protease with chaperone function